MWGRMAEARDQLTAALEVLRTDPDTDTVRVLKVLALLEVLGGSPDADRLTTEVITLGQSLDVDPGLLSGLFEVRGIYHGIAGRRPQAAAYFRESTRLATLAADNVELAAALVNLSDALAVTDPAAGAEAARAAAGHLRRAGQRDRLAFATGNLVQALLMLGDWDAAEQELTQTADSDGLQDYPFLSCYRGLLAALRGDVSTAETMLASLGDLRTSEDLQMKSLISLVEAATAAARREYEDVLRHASGALAYVSALGISAEDQRWAWTLAARAAHELRDLTVARELLSLLDSYQPGQLAPMLRAERDLARVRLAAVVGGQPVAASTATAVTGQSVAASFAAAVTGQSVAASFAAAVTGLRERGTPYHLAQGLLDYAEYLTREGDADAAAQAVGEARDIARRLRCQPLLDRAGAIEGAPSRVRA